MGQNSSTPKPLVVIVGGGYGGLSLAKKLETQANVLLIDKKNYFFHNIAALRAAVNATFVPKIMIPYEFALQSGRFLQGTVTKITKDEVIVEGYSKGITFDYLVIATGTSYSFPSKNYSKNMKDVGSAYTQIQAKIKEAKSITLVGAGPVGIELAGEIGFAYREKQVTIVSASDNIIPGPFSNEFRDSVKQRIKETFPKVNLILGERVIVTDEMKETLQQTLYLVGNRTIETNKSNKIETDLVIFCTGSKMNSSAYEEDFKNSVNQDNHRLKCKSTLQVEGYENVFAIGDCADAGPTKAYEAQLQADVVANNIIQIDAKRLDKIKHWEISRYAGIVIPLGPEQGAGQLPLKSGKVVGAKVTSMIKGGDLFCSRNWKMFANRNPSNEVTESNYGIIKEEDLFQFIQSSKKQQVNQSNVEEEQKKDE